MKKFTYQTQAELLDKAYLTCSELTQLVPIGRKNAYELMREIEQEMERENIPCFITRPRLVPTTFVVEKLGLDVNYIRRQAARSTKGVKEQ